MSFNLVKGMRDFYPDEMALRNWLTDAWRRVSLRNGFVEFDGPTVEYLDLYKAKSGEGIVSELFNFVDRGGRELALRPEITPTLARMINARINSLPRPIKWFSIPQCFRAENPQKGRTREFLQWNVDIIGADDVLADAECIFTAVDFLMEAGLTPEDVQVHIGSRPLTMEALRKAGVAEGAMERALAALDKRPKVSHEDFVKIAADADIPAGAVDDLCRFQDAPDTEAVKAILGDEPGVKAATGDLNLFFSHLKHMEVQDFCRLDMRMVRGLAYYTGIVYEVLDAGGSLRAVGGGGRYDNLLEVLGGPKIGATGFGMGDPVLCILLKEKGKLPQGLTGGIECFVAAAEPALLREALRLVGGLRRQGIAADYSIKQGPLGKQLKEANRRGARFTLIVQQHPTAPTAAVVVKDMKTGEQAEPVGMADFLANPRRHLGA